jgi:hypothetical protein
MASGPSSASTWPAWTIRRRIDFHLHPEAFSELLGIAPVINGSGGRDRFAIRRHVLLRHGWQVMQLVGCRKDTRQVRKTSAIRAVLI